MSQDQKFFDIFTLVLGILVAIAFAIYMLSARIGNATQGQYVLSESAYQEQITSSIQPLGAVMLPGEEEIARQKSAAAAAAPVATVLSGPQVYNAGLCGMPWCWRRRRTRLRGGRSMDRAPGAG